MKIVADENIPYAREAFGQLGEVETMAGRLMSADALRDAAALFVRSVTKVDAALLEGTAVRFVGTATIGEDHVDKAWLADQGVGFSSAPGCNANSVGEYVAAALLFLAKAKGLRLQDCPLGVVGVGNAGSRVAEKAAALGLPLVLNDPPLALEIGDERYRPIEEILDCGVITLHVPLTRDGADPTYHMVDEAFLERLKPGTIVINASRGAVVDNKALLAALKSGRLGGAVLDVWEGEPDVDIDLLETVDIATPHIAGYSFDGKVNGTRQIHEAACRFFGHTPTWDPEPLLPPPDRPEIEIDGAQDWLDAITQAVFAVYDIRNDDAAMRMLSTAPPAKRPALFDQLRKDYPRRREFHNTRALATPPNPETNRTLQGLGFAVKERVSP